MGVLVNYKICDNAAECSGIEFCPTGALFWDQEKEQIGVNNDLCISCHECENACPVGAIRVANDEINFAIIENDIKNDRRTREDLFVERYGAMPIDEEMVVNDDTIDRLVQQNQYVFIEQFQEGGIQCLLHSIPVELIVNKYGCIYRKQLIPDECDGSFPRLLIYSNAILVGEIRGYFEESSKEDFFEKIENIIMQQ